MRWQVGDDVGQMMALPVTAWEKDAAILPGEDELLLWGRDGVLVADQSGCPCQPPVKPA